ncbi:immunoglobulin lambda-1 light chain-like isoform X1 [Clarias gariepinus]|uniref:immunoglobulin lambda-1 light chain-like isoform X1 n=1 Tax=Clarias gariepinus TaxID=13013 RepID=UPI00234D97F3|nr:immunoglobulin lambda-1 light chain-like isoform X1 [Clarias gariepinus]
MLYESWLRSVHHSADQTDIMLLTVCALLPALAVVSSQKVVTQKPPVITVDKGNSVTMDCNIAKDENKYVYWYKQIPQETTEFVLRFYHSHSAPDKYGDNFSSTRFTSKASSNIDYQLIISNVEVGDSAVYYCNTYDNSTKEWVFGQGTKLIVNDAALPAPVLTVLPPSSEELESKKATLVCLASDVGRYFADVRWLVNGNSVTSGVITGAAQQQTNKKFTLSSYLTLDICDWENNKVITCEVSAGGKAASVNINRSACSIPT